ncbi:MAG: hypothetical protein JXR36_15030 [Bacteroidales bacterium]|nr:hypothetical protein [Bacteroidales bacterium]
MEQQITAKEAIELIKTNKYNGYYIIKFDDEKITFQDAILLGRFGIDVPENFIFYDDDNIDYSDIPELTQDDINSGKVIPYINAHIPLENEIREWIKKENINIGELTGNLIKNFYENIKTLYKNTAL